MRVLVTGASGFIGQHLREALDTAGHEIVPVIHLSDPNRPGGVAVDIGPATDWSALLAGVDAVVHIAARVHVLREENRDPRQAFWQINVDGTMRLARQAAAAGVKRFIYVSSAGVQGVESRMPFTERDVPTPVSWYAKSKWESEQQLHAFAISQAMDVVILRPPLVYGPGVKANFHRLLTLVNFSMPLPLGSVRNARDFIYVGNLVDAILCGMDEAKQPGTYLVSDGEAISVPELMREIAHYMGRRCWLVPFPVALLRLAGQALGQRAAIESLCNSLQLDIAKIQTAWGWKPPIPRQEGLRRTVDWYLKLRHKT